MSWLEALILGIIQGLTEFLPVSSSGHLTILSNLFGLEGESNLTMIVALHVATVLSTLTILWKEVVWIFKDLFTKQSWKSYSGLNEGTKFAINILISMIPVAIVGFCFKDTVEEIFGSGLLIVGIMLLVTAALLTFSYYAKPRQREEISPLHAFIIGIGQAVAVLPGLSRSGTTIATGLISGVKRESMAQFSFLMVLVPIIGEQSLDILKAALGTGTMGGGVGVPALLVGFAAAFLSGLFACKLMISLVRKARLSWFSLYCVIVAVLLLVFAK